MIGPYIVKPYRGFTLFALIRKPPIREKRAFSIPQYLLTYLPTIIIIIQIFSTAFLPGEWIVGKSICILILLIGYQICLAQDKTIPPKASPVDFFREEITLTVSDSVSKISGIYYFRVNVEHNGNMPIIFPFYVDSLSLFPDSMFAYILNGADSTKLEIRPAKMKNAVLIIIPIKSKGITVWHFDYSQKIKSARATYIITSTSAWGKPLDDATYRFMAPAHFSDVQAWPEPDSSTVKGDTREYLAHRTNFMPTHDMVISWKSK